MAGSSEYFFISTYICVSVLVHICFFKNRRTSFVFYTITCYFFQLVYGFLFEAWEWFPSKILRQCVQSGVFFFSCLTNCKTKMLSVVMGPKIFVQNSGKKLVSVKLKEIESRQTLINKNDFLQKIGKVLFQEILMSKIWDFFPWVIFLGNRFVLLMWTSRRTTIEFGLELAICWNSCLPYNF